MGKYLDIQGSLVQARWDQNHAYSSRLAETQACSDLKHVVIHVSVADWAQMVI
jgi:hypothetical protein